MKWRRTIRNSVLGVIGAIAVAVTMLLVRGRWEDHQLVQRLAHIDRALSTARVTRSACAAPSACECQVEAASDTFEACTIIDGHVALWIRSNERCFSQWVAIDSTWAWDGSAERVGVLWISERPRVTTASWTVLAVAPCVD